MERKKIDLCLRKVIEKEQELYDLYKELANECPDKRLQLMFGELSRDAFMHLNLLVENHMELVDSEFSELKKAG